MNQSPVPGPRSGQDAPSTGQQPLAVGALIAWAIGHDAKRISRKGIQARELLADLRTLRAEEERQELDDAEEQRLLAALAAVRARREQRRTKRTPSGVDQAAVRAWARENGLTVPDRGNVPAAIVAAWRAATGKAA
ncbi:Lsr2 family DNA-binding protein [Streptomyces sp. NPDC002526]